jgi:hypothetical protein
MDVELSALHSLVKCILFWSYGYQLQFSYTLIRPAFCCQMLGIRISAPILIHSHPSSPLLPDVGDKDISSHSHTLSSVQLSGPRCWRYGYQIPFSYTLIRPALCCQMLGIRISDPIFIYSHPSSPLLPDVGDTDISSHFHTLSSVLLSAPRCKWNCCSVLVLLS